jgi:hypothetical protein
MALSVYKMTRDELIAELESFPMEVIGNVHDLRQSVKLGREICRSFKEVWTQDEKEVIESLLELSSTDPLDSFIESELASM